MQRSIGRLIFSMAFGFLANASMGQANFSGSWSLKQKEYISGPQYVNALPDKLVISQEKDSLIFHTIYRDEDGSESGIRHSIPMNGKAISNFSTSLERKFTRRLQWSEDKNELTITTQISLAGNENEVDLTRVETWKFYGGQLLVEIKSLETTSENWEAKGLFE